MPSFRGTSKPIANIQRVEWECIPTDGEPLRVCLERSGNTLCITLGDQSTAVFIPLESQAALTEMFAFRC